MKKKMIFGVSIFCIGTVLTELAALGVFAIQGKVTDKTIVEFQAVLDGEYKEQAIEADVEAEAQTPHSQAEIDRERIDRSYQLGNRRTEIELISKLLRKRGDLLLEKQGKIKADKEKFAEQLDKFQKNNTADSAEIARGILLKMTPEDAVTSLMPSTLEQNILLLKGMQEKKIAGILQQFIKSRDPKIVKRGQDIFQAISMGEPEKKLVESTIKKVKPAFKQHP